jgi:hypothetical protein
METQTSKINTLIEKPDNVEIIRDQIAAILKLEIEHQSFIDSENNDFCVKVFIENARPLETETDDENPCSRFINVQLTRADIPKSNARVGRQGETAIFFIDCTTYGGTEGDYYDDKESALKAWRIARLVRNILTSGVYTYLGLQGVVRSRVIPSRESGAPPMQSEAQAATVVRITLEVDFIENTIDAEYETLDVIKFECDSDTGEILINIDFDCHKEA